MAFNEIMSDLIASRAAEYVDVVRDSLKQGGFNLNSVESEEDFDEESGEIEEEPEV